MATFDDSKREFYFEEQIRSVLIKHIVDFDYAKALRDMICNRHDSDTVLVLVEL